ncbi:hypothetical protein HUJ05_011819 [Dendroctonus ponderosae]|nr:hypothetical protein HUJ05_011819 [Dendroctonus ponderosae]
MSKGSSSGSLSSVERLSDRTLNSNNTRINERIPIILRRPTSYGSVFPYFHFVRASNGRYDSNQKKILS